MSWAANRPATYMIRYVTDNGILSESAMEVVGWFKSLARLPEGIRRVDAKDRDRKQLSLKITERVAS